MRSLWLSLFAAVLLAFSIAGCGDAYEEGLAAYEVGEYETALRLWLPLAEEGHAGAQHKLGRLYLTGQGVANDYEMAVKWFRSAAKQGYEGAQDNLREAELALQAQNGGAETQTRLGLLYEEGRGVPRDFTKAVYWHRLAAEQGYAEAQYRMGVIYGLGRGVPQDKARAVIWHRLAAEQGLAPAQYNLGFAYEHGFGAPQSDQEAVKWYRLAAEQGDADAQSAIGRLQSGANTEAAAEQRKP